jgi:phosphoserine phosphatase RsbU/P
MASSPVRDRVLIVDDVAVNLKLLRAILLRAGHEVIEATSGQEALERVREAAPDLILLDVMMPGMDGYEVCRLLKADPATAAVPVVFVSALGEVTERIKGLEIGAEDYLSKPFDNGEVVARVKAQLRLRHLTRALEEQSRELQAKQRHIEEDLRAAAEIQRALLPRPGVRVPGLSAAWLFEPCSTIGGDIFDLFALDDDHAAAYVIDVSGHGVPPALLTVSVSQALSLEAGATLLHHADGSRSAASPSAVLGLLDRDYPIERFGMFFTIAYLVLRRSDGLLRYSCAGHPPPLLVRPDGEVRPLPEGGPIIGLGVGLGYEEGSVRLSPGDRVVLYTDGVVEFMDPAREVFGDARLEALLRERRAEPLDRLCDAIRSELARHARGAEAIDDVSILALEYQGPAAGAQAREMTVTSEIGNVAKLGLLANEVAESCGLDEMGRFHVELCVVEAATNCVLHAYGGAPGRPITLVATMEDGLLRLAIRDEGIPIPEERRGAPPDLDETEEALLREGGRGLFLIHRLMDRVSYAPGPPVNELLLEKSVPAGKGR